MKRPSAAKANAKLRRLLGDLYAKVDAHHEQTDRAGAPAVSCQPGCASAPRGCCSLLTLIELAEADLIIARHEAAVRAALPALLRAYHRACEAGLTPEAMFMSDNREHDEIASRYHSLYEPCPFLDAERRCTVYESRPIACRTHFVVSPPEECEPSGVNDQHLTLDMGTRVAAQAWFLNNVARERRGEFAIGALPQVVLFAWLERFPDALDESTGELRL